MKTLVSEKLDKVSATKVAKRQLVALGALLLAATVSCGSLSRAQDTNASAAPQLHQIGNTNGAQVLAIARYKQEPQFGTPIGSALLAGGEVGARQQQQPSSHPDAPKLIPLSALDRYQEGSDLRLFCSASAPPTGGGLQFEWHKNQNNEPLLGQIARNLQQRAHISMMDESASVLRIGQLEAADSGNYTCLARNQFGQDTSTVRVQVNVRLKWIAEPPGEIHVRAGKLLQLECDASGQPAPLISWTSLKDRRTITSKVLRFDRVTVNDSGLYECRAISPLALTQNSHQHYHQQQQQQQQSNKQLQFSPSNPEASGGEQLRKMVRLVVNVATNDDDVL